MKTSILLGAILFSVVSVRSQGGRPIPPGIRQADHTIAQSEKNIPPPLYQHLPNDLSKLKHDADELASLANSIQVDIEGVQKGILQKDVIEKLKQVEKLSKRLRSQLAH